MENSIFRADTYGIGQILTQKKRLEVPLHQRNYSWGSEEVDQFLEDIFTAIDEDYSSYFLGSLVLTQPLEATWGILDGQQRLTTTSIIYSSIRSILYGFGNESDAMQVESEFLGVRNLGGDYYPRLILNSENRETYMQAVVNSCTEDELNTLLNFTNQSRSNKLLINAVKLCRQRIMDWCTSGAQNETESTHKLYRLSSYIESNILVVSIEVANESDAYVVFETLNTRGQDLSALDLVKNYIFGTSDVSNHNIINEYWDLMKSNIGTNQADDFLRIFWMGNYGLIQKSRLYPNLKNKFNTPLLSFELSKMLYEASGIYAAIEEPKHEFWQGYSSYSKHLLEMLKLFRSKQTRPIIYACAALGNINNQKLEEVLWILLVLTIRFQTVGKNRQGILEKHCAKVAQTISQNGQVNVTQIKEELEIINPNDDEFKQDFLKYSETNMKRILYFLGAIELSHNSTNSYYKSLYTGIEDYLNTKTDTSVTHIMPKNVDHGNSSNGFNIDDNLNLTNRIGNYILIDNSVNLNLKNDGYDVFKNGLANCQYWSTSILTHYSSWNLDAFANRSDKLASLAINLWKIG